MSSSEPSAAPPPLPESVFRRSWKLVMIAGALGGTYYTFCINGAPRVSFLTQLGATPFDFGLMSALGAAAILFQIFGGILNRRISHRKPVWMISCIAHRLVFLGVLAAPIFFAEPRWRIWWIIAVSATHDALANLGGPIWASWMADILPKETLSREWARRQRFTTFWAMIAAICMALFFDRFETAHRVPLGFTILGLTGVTLGVMDILLFTPVPEPPHNPTRGGNPFKDMLEPLKDPEFRPFLVFRAYWQLVASLAFPFFVVYMIQEMKMDAMYVQIIFMLGGVGVIASTRIWGLLCDTYGQRPVMMLLLFGKMLIPLVFVVAPPYMPVAIPLLCVVIFIDGVMNSAFDLSSQGIILKSTPRHNRAMYIAANNFFALGLPAIVSPLLSGWIINHFKGHYWHVGIYAFTGYHMIFLLSCLLRTCSIPLASRLKEPESLPLGVMLSHLRAANPFAVTRRIYRLVESDNPAARSRAAFELGNIGSPLAIRELIKALGDSSREVRQSSAEALGKIGASEACAPLARALTDPALGIQSPAAHALGLIGGYDSLQALLKNLRNLEPDALGETVDSLAHIGDSAAILPLICLMDEHQDPAMKNRIAAALARLTTGFSAEEIILMFNAPNPAPRRKNS